MKKRLLNKIALGMACVLGVGGVVTVNAISSNAKQDIRPTYAYNKMLSPIGPSNFTVNSQILNNVDTDVWSSVICSEPDYGRAKAKEVGTDYVVVEYPNAGADAYFAFSSGARHVFTKCSFKVQALSSNLSYIVKKYNSDPVFGSGTLSTTAQDYTVDMTNTDDIHVEVQFKTSIAQNITLKIYNIKLYEYSSEPQEQTVNISAGTGVSEVYLSTSSTATSGSSSGSSFNIGDTVYGFATLKAGYSVPSTWTLVSGTKDTAGSKYRVGSQTVGDSTVNFGTQNAILITYSITYNLNGGTHGTTHPNSYNVNTSTFTISNPTKTGYTFKGWSGTELSGDTNKNISVAKGSVGNRTYTANWTANQYTVTFDRQGGTTGSTSVSATYASAMPSATMPTRLGYVFGGYYTEPNGGGTKYYNANGTSAKNWDIASATTLYAKWTIYNYTINYNLDGGSATNPINYTINDADITLNNPTKTGYDFIGWTGTGLSEKTMTVTIPSGSTGDRTYVANYEYNPTIQTVIDAINDIGLIDNTPESKALVDHAKELYDALSNEYKAVLAADSPETLKTLTDDVAAFNAIDAINAIGVVEPTDASKVKIDDARNIYDALTSDQKAIFPSSTLKTLEDDEVAYPVIKEIGDIGKLTYDGGVNDSKEAIEHAEASYYALSEDQKKVVDASNHNQLVGDRNTYDNVKNACDLIVNIGAVSNSEESKAKLDSARAAYDALNEEGKALVAGFNSSLKTLEDGEKVYEALVAIDNIGEVIYDHESEERIEEARAVYDSLTEDQKSTVGAHYLSLLVNAEQNYASKKTTGNILVIVFIVISILLLLIGSYVLYRQLKKKKNKDDDNQNPSGGSEVKAMSFSLPLLLVGATSTSCYLDAPYIALYIIAGLTILVWLANLIVFILKKKGIIATEDEAPAISSEEYNDEEIQTVTDANGNVFRIRYIKSFTAKLIQSSDETKGYYEELKNFALSYEGTASRISWNYDSINVGKVQFLKFGIRGKTLCLYLPLNPEELDEKYKVERIESLKYEKVPCMYRINNERRIRYAKTLIRMVASKLKIKLGEEKHESYVLPYEDRDALVAKGLIRVNKSLADKPEEEVLSIKEDEEGNEIITTQDTEGHIYETRLVKSFTARFIQADDEVKAVYNELKNYALSYDKASARLSWLYDSINVSKEPLLKFNIKRGVLCIYYALDITKLGEKYKVEKADAKKYSKVPCLYKVNARRINYAKELIDRVMRKNKLVMDKEVNDDYILPFEEKDALIKKGYIRESKIRIK